MTTEPNALHVAQHAAAIVAALALRNPWLAESIHWVPDNEFTTSFGVRADLNLCGGVMTLRVMGATGWEEAAPQGVPVAAVNWTDNKGAFTCGTYKQHLHATMYDIGAAAQFAQFAQSHGVV
jgi:hypothetical protein